MYIIKQQPEDFIVKEISNVEIKDRGKYIYFKLKKTNMNTLDAIKNIVRIIGVKEKQIGFAGSKDKRAVTEQMISFFGTSKKKVERIELENISLEFTGYGNKPISLGDLAGNKFEIIVRDINNRDVNNRDVNNRNIGNDNVGVVFDKIKFIENYFDEQRFGSNNSAVGRCLIKKDFASAIKLIDDKKLNEYLETKKNDYVGALKLLPIRLLRLYVNAYQSYLWNETLAAYLLEKSLAVKKVKYSLGEFVFVKEHFNPDLDTDFDIPLIGFNDDLIKNKNLIKEIINKLMEREKIGFNNFVIKQIPEISLEGEMRKAFVEVKDLVIGKIKDDDLNKDKKKVLLKFSLKKGSYATIVVKRILSFFLFFILYRQHL